MRISDWSSDVCSSDLTERDERLARTDVALEHPQHRHVLRHIARDLAPDALLRTGQAEGQFQRIGQPAVTANPPPLAGAQPLPDQHQRRSHEHTSELQSLMRISYAAFCLKKKTTN